MSVKSQHVTKPAIGMRSPISSGALTPVRGFAGNHTLVRKGRETDETQPRLQRKENGSTPQLNVMDQPLQDDRREVENRTGMPGPLKAGLETLSGMDLSGIRVHRNSSKPDQLNALAYTQGQEIHLGPGQEAHLAHEGWHAVQQMQGRVQPTIQAKGKSINDDTSLEHEADLMGAKALRTISFGQNRGNQKFPACLTVAPSAAYGSRPTIQREMKFELQTTNRIWRNDGVHPPSLLDRKYGPYDFLVNGKSGVRLETETDGVLEFETEWFRKWSELKEALEEAVAMTNKMSEAPPVGEGRRAFPFDVGHLREGTTRELRRGVWDRKEGYEGANEKILGKEERLEVEIVDDKWKAAIQSSESIALTQFESLLKEHHPARLEHTVSHADVIVKEAAKSAKKPEGELANLRSFLQIIFYYIEQGQRVDLRKKGKIIVPPQAAKFAFVLMNRTSFSSIYRSLLTEPERDLFDQIVKEKLILKELIDKDEELELKEGSKFFKWGHGGSTTLGPTIDQWLKSIVSPGRFGRKVKNKKGEEVDRDLLSPPKHGSAAMGAFDVQTKPGKKQTKLVRFETRDTTPAHMGGRVQPATNWVDYARELFKYAAENRKRPESEDDPATPKIETEKTTLIYDPKVLPARFEVLPKFTLELGDQKKPGFELEFRRLLPTLLGGKLQPFIYTGVGTGAISAGVGASFDPFKAMSLFLTGKGGIRSEWFTSIEVGGSLEAGWAFGKNRSLRLGVGWEEWRRLDADEQRSHLVNVFLGKRF